MVKTSVLVIGAGPVGLTLALDLGLRGIDVTVVEMRAAAEAPPVKCNAISSRSMEVFRRLGVSHKLREVGLPMDHSTDVASVTSVVGMELSRLAIPSRRERLAGVAAEDSWWPTPEPSHRVNQLFFEPVLFRHAADQKNIRILSRHEFLHYEQTEDCVTARVRNLETGGEEVITSKYLVGCDGGRSLVRTLTGAEFEGTPQIQRTQSSFIRAPKLQSLLGERPAWMYFVLNPRRCGTVIAIDGKEHWNVHNFLYKGEDYHEVDRNWAIRQILGVQDDFEYEIISQENWMGRRIVANKMRDRRVFLAGDACHLWIPAAGYGMNAGIADAADLAWMLAAVLHQWAAPALLDAYQAERKPITEQISHIITDVAVEVMKQRREVPDNIEAPTKEGAEARVKLGEESRLLEVKQQCAAGLNFGYFYDQSPIIAYNGEAQPPYSMHEFTPAAVPGCRAPHVWLSGKRSLYDELGEYYTLVRTNSSEDVSELVTAAAKRRVPLKVIDLTQEEAGGLYKKRLTLVRPDQYVAWGGDAIPDSSLALVDFVRGAGAPGMTF